MISYLLICVSFFTMVSCSDNGDHIGEAKTPSSSSVLNGQNYEDVVKIFEDKGFTNIHLEKVEDLIFGWLTKDGEVEEVSVGGDVNYSSDKWVPNDIEVIIKYHTFVIEEASTEVINEENTNQGQIKDNSVEVNDVILTVENCIELATILSMKADGDSAYKEFAEKYKGKTIEFDGRIDYITNHNNYNTRYDILVSAGDYNPDSQIGPTFKFEDVAAYDLDLHTLYLEEAISVGMNVRIVAKVKSYNVNSYLFFLEPISVSAR